MGARLAAPPVKVLDWLREKFSRLKLSVRMYPEFYVRYLPARLLRFVLKPKIGFRRHLPLCQVKNKSLKIIVSDI